jgi:hypothetical protein
MARLSPTFRNIFASSETITSRQIELGFDPTTFNQIARSAHGYFIPQANVSLRVLVSLAQVIKDLLIPAESPLYILVDFCFLAHTAHPGSIPLRKLAKLLQVARALGPARLDQFLLDIFDFHHGTSFASPSDTDKDSRAFLLSTSALFEIPLS